MDFKIIFVCFCKVVFISDWHVGGSLVDSPQLARFLLSARISLAEQRNS